MKITIKGKNSGVTDELIKYAERKIGKLEKYSQRIQSATVTFIEGASKKRSKSFGVEVALATPGATLRSQEEKDSFRTALDSVVEKLEEQVRRLKTKRIDKTRERSAEEAVVAVEPAVYEEEVLGPVVYVERFPAKPLSAAEAIANLELAGREFYLFVNESATVNCVYKRRDGGYGLLVPEDEVL
jgi:putative sigma-54 modulation protein